MNKAGVVSGIILSIIFVFMNHSQAAGPSIDKLIADNIKARGGLSNLHAIKSGKMSGKMTLTFGHAAAGMQAPIVMWTKRPNKIRMEMTMQGQSVLRAYNGKMGWQLMPFMGNLEPQKMPEEETRELQELSDLEGPLVDYAKKGNKVVYAGKTEVQGTPAHKLKVTFKNGVKQIIYLDEENLIEIKSTSFRKRQGNTMEVDIYFGDYKEVGGVMFAHSFESKVQGKTVAQISIEKIELNIPIDNKIFDMPPKSSKDTTKATSPAKKAP